MYRGLLFLERMTFRSADVVITTNESHKRIALERGGLAPEDVFIVRSGPDLDRFKVYEPDPSWKQGKPSCSSISARCASRTASIIWSARCGCCATS